MFVIMSSTPRYGSRDEVAGYRKMQEVPYAYETLALAQRMIGRKCYQYDEEGYPLADETHYFVADTSDPYRRPVQAPRAKIEEEYFDDIPF